MSNGRHLLVGIAATAIVTLISHFATADRFVARLQQLAKANLAAENIEGVTVKLGQDPLTRHAGLYGMVSEDAKQRALAAVNAVPGIADAHWRGDDPGGLAGNGNMPSSPANIAQCQTNIDQIIAAKKISFRSGSAYLSPESNRILDAVAAALSGCTGGNIVVEGHSDDNGNKNTNQLMSQERADRVAAALVARGIAKERIEAIGHGADKPIAGANDAGNRRIEFTIRQNESPQGPSGQAAVEK